MTIIPKFDGGGAALPFVDYMPMGAGATAEVPGSDVGATTTSKAAKSGDDDSIGLKDLLKLASQVDGLPSDLGKVTEAVRNIYKEASLFNDGEMSTDALVTTYLSALQKIKVAGFNKEQFKEARDQVTANGGLHEIAIREDGRVFVQDVETGKAQWATLEEYSKLKEKHPEKYEALTNSNLLYYRAEHPSFSFKNDVLDTVSNGIGWKKVTEMLQQAAAHVGSEEVKREGYSYQSQQKIQAGLAQMQQAAASGMPIAGLYKHGSSEKSNQSDIQLAMNYLWHTMPTNARTWLKYRGGGTEEGAKQIMAELLFSQTQESHQQTIQYSGDPEYTKAMQAQRLAMQAAKATKEKESDLKTNPYVQMIRQQGGDPVRLPIAVEGSTAAMTVDGVNYGQVPKVNRDMSINELLATGLQGIVTSRDAITFGDQAIGSENLKDVMYDNKGCTVATLPCKLNQNGQKVVNLDAVQKWNEAQAKIKALPTEGVSQEQYEQAVTGILQESGLAYLVTPDGKFNSNLVAEFMVVDAYTTDKIKFNYNSPFVHKVNSPDKALQDKLIHGLSTDKDHSNYSVDVDDTFGWFEGTYDDVYHSNVYIPITQNQNAAFNAWGQQIKDEQAYGKEEDYQVWSRSQSAQSADSSFLDEDEDFNLTDDYNI